jgi:ABC-type proline/glycine betaine transport system substrate-binding protein
MINLAKMRFRHVVAIMALSSMTLAMFAALVTAADDQPETQIVISERDYTIRDGETLRGIAQRELGKIGLAPHLAEFNNIALDSALQAGQVIQIPLYAEVEKEFATVVFVKGNARWPRGG